MRRKNPCPTRLSRYKASHSCLEVLYRPLPSFQDYLLISAEEPYIEHYCKTDAVAWTFTSYGEINAALWLSNLQLSIPLSEIYRRVNFPIS
jgi:hypothetical protein